MVLVVPRLPTPAPPHPSATEVAKKKRKKWGNRLGRRVLRRGRDPHPLNNPFLRSPLQKKLAKVLKRSSRLKPSYETLLSYLAQRTLLHSRQL